MYFLIFSCCGQPISVSEVQCICSKLRFNALFLKLCAKKLNNIPLIYWENNELFIDTKTGLKARHIAYHEVLMLP